MANGYWNWQTFFQALDQWGLTDVLLPFLLVFVIVFAILQKTKILGNTKEAKKYNVMVSFVLGFMFVMPHVLGRPVLGYDPVLLINSVLPTVSVLAIAVIMLLVLVGVFAAGEYQGAKGFYGFVVIAAIVALVYIFGAAAGWWVGWSWLDNLLGSDTIAVIVMILVFGLIISFVVGEDKESSGEKFLDKFEKMFK